MFAGDIMGVSDETHMYNPPRRNRNCAEQGRRQDEIRVDTMRTAGRPPIPHGYEVVHGSWTSNVSQKRTRAYESTREPCTYQIHRIKYPIQYSDDMPP